MEEIIDEYEKLLISDQSEFTLECFNSKNAGGYNEKLALHCIKYALEKILGWDEEQAIQKFDSYMINILKLHSLIRFIDFPPDIEYGNCRYILSRIYPKKIKYSQKELTNITIDDILSGKRSQFPRNYFLGVDGFKRYCYCIKYLIEVYEPFSDIEDIYEYFLSPQGNAFLSKYKLKIPTYQYKLDVFQAIRTITSNDPDGELYYCYYMFKRELEKGI